VNHRVTPVEMGSRLGKLSKTLVANVFDNHYHLMALWLKSSQSTSRIARLFYLPNDFEVHFHTE
jgi:hypothetical protein